MNLEKLKYMTLHYFFKPKPVPQPSEREYFKDLETIWRPSNSKPKIVLRWFMTEWCNYKCPYCPQEHSRNRFRGSFRIHSFDNYKPAEWCRAIERNLIDKAVAITITGGEPMLDIKNMRVLLSTLLSNSY